MVIAHDFVNRLKQSDLNYKGFMRRKALPIGHLHDVVILLLLRPESFSFFLSYLNFVILVRFE